MLSLLRQGYGGHGALSSEQSGRRPITLYKNELGPSASKVPEVFYENKGRSYIVKYKVTKWYYFHSLDLLENML